MQRTAFPRPKVGTGTMLLIGAALALAFAALLSLAPHLARAELWHYDEWYTAERVHNILARPDWLTLYENGMPVFKKPPLQYWLSAVLSLAGVPNPLALRLPSFLAAFGVLALSAHLAWRLSGKAAAVPVALALILCSDLFWITSTSALLETGAAFFLTLAVTALFHAWHNPRWWWLAALAVGLGALQKAPVAAVALPFAVAFLRLTGSRPAAPGRHIHALWLALALVLVWPVTQSLLHGTAAVETAVIREQLLRFLPGAEAWGRHFRWIVWITGDSALLWGGLIVGSLCLPLTAPSPQARAAALLVLAFFAALTAATGEIFDRYLVLILPLAAAACAAFLVRLSHEQGLVGALALAIGAGGPLKTATEAGLTHEGIAAYRPILGGFRAALGPDDKPVICRWGQSDLVVFPGALWLLASGDKPFLKVWSPDDLTKALASGTVKPPLRGLCLDAEYKALARLIPLHPVASSQGWVHWTLP